MIPFHSESYQSLRFHPSNENNLEHILGCLQHFDDAT